MHKYISPVILIVALLLSSGCALTRSESKIVYTPQIGGSALSNPPSRSVEIGDVADHRGIEDATTIFQKRNMYGQTMSGSYAADRPIAQILKEGLKKGIEVKGFSGTGNVQNVELRASIEDYTHEVVAGFWKATLKPKMTVRFDLIDKASGKSIWHDTIVGRSTISNGDYVVQSVTATIDDVVTQLVTNQTFIDIVK